MQDNTANTAQTIPLFVPGQKIGAYRIVRLLGQGGMGVVYEVEHEQLGVHYALKAFSTNGRHADILKKKFLMEGRVLARLHDPHLIRVFDLAVDAETGVPYFVMDIVTYKDGLPRTLDDVEPCDIEEDDILLWFEDLCRALDYIHAQGVVHRDVKLGNVLLREDGHAMLSDFGVSRIFGTGLSKAVNVTRTVVQGAKSDVRYVMGTGAYLAPEVQRGEEASPAADVYSLGVVFFHLLTGLWYEPGTRALALLDCFKYRWIAVLAQMLAANPQDRPLNLSCLPRQLRQSGASKADAPAKQWWPGVGHGKFKARWFAAVAAVLCVAAALFAAMVLRPQAKEQEPAEQLTTWPAPPEQDDFREIFSADDVFRYREAAK